MADLPRELATAERYWLTRKSGDQMIKRARTCWRIMRYHLGAEVGRLGSASHATELLARLSANGTEPQTVVNYYTAWRRACQLSGFKVTDWPKPPTIPRKVRREPIDAGDLQALSGWLISRGYTDTQSLLVLLNGTGMRVDVEALRAGAWEVMAGAALRITGKGGHERVIPIADPVTAALLEDEARLKAMFSTPYRTHVRRWKDGVKALGITSRLPTPHSVRHAYATRAYAKCKDLRLVQHLLGHADVNTTARYVGVDMEAMRSAVVAG